jgi:RNA polymerase-binding transcription factor DksA
MAPGTPRKPSKSAPKSAASKPAPAAKAAAAKKAPAEAAKKTTAAGARARPAGKQALPAPKKPAAKRAPAKQPAKSTPAKKTPAKKTPAKKTPAKTSGKQAAPKAPPAKAPRPPKKPTTVICPLSGFEVKPDKPNLSPRTVERLRMKLVEERARHVQQAEELLAEAEALAIEREGGDTQFDEESGEGDTVNIERERDLLLSASARQIVDEIDRALERIAAKTYGLCVPAGRRISLERLEALPYAETCVDCKARAERRR